MRILIGSIMVLLILNLAVVFGAFYSLRREFKTANKKTVERLAGVCHVLQRIEDDMNSLLKGFLQENAGTNDALQEIWKRLELLPELKNSVEALLREKPEIFASDDDAKHSRAIEEGISNLLQYQVGKGREQL